MTDSPENADDAAMRRLQDGDDIALNEIIDRWRDRLTRYLLRRIGHEAVALDLAEETFVRVYQSKARYDPRGTFSTWLFAIATNLARQHFRWQERHPAVSLDEGSETEGDSLGERLSANDPDPSNAAQREEQAQAVRDAVMSLPDDLRNAVVLSEYEDLPSEQIAKISRCSLKAIESRLYRARGILREKLKSWLLPPA